jgi:hypothetical protein
VKTAATSIAAQYVAAMGMVLIVRMIAVDVMTIPVVERVSAAPERILVQ